MCQVWPILQKALAKPNKEYIIVVGVYNGTSSISAVNIGSQLMQIITSFVIGCSMGCTMLTGRQTEVNRQQKRLALFRQLLYFAIQHRKNLN